MVLTDIPSGLAVSTATHKDDKQLRQLHGAILPKLSAYGTLPNMVMPSLLKLVSTTGDEKKEHRRLLRMLLYFMQLLLGPGDAGTPAGGSGDAGEASITTGKAVLDLNMLRQAWDILKDPHGDPAERKAMLRALAAAVRAVQVSSLKEKPPVVTQLMEMLVKLLSKDTQANAKARGGLFRRPREGQKDVHKEKAMLQGIVLSSARVALKGVGQRKMLQRSYDSLSSGDPVTVRHALAIAAEMAMSDPQEYTKRVKPLLEVNLSLYEQAGYVFSAEGAPSKAPAGGAANGESGQLILSDPFSRMYLARGCGAVVHSEGSNREPNGSVFLRALVAMAARDPLELVGMEAVKALAGAHPPEAMDPSPATAHKHNRGKRFTVDSSAASRDKSIRMAAWSLLVNHRVPGWPPWKGLPVEANDGLLISEVVLRLRRCLGSESKVTVCGACRAAAEVAKARALALSLKGKAKRGRVERKPRNDLMYRLREDLVQLATGSRTATEQHLAVVPLIWLQGPEGGPLTPQLLSSIVGSVEGWTEDLLSMLLNHLFQRLYAEPSMANYVLECVSAVATGCPSGLRPEELCDFWSALAYEQADKVLVLKAALQFLQARSPARTRAPSGSNLATMAKAAEEAAAWQQLQRIATWWVGEAANFVAAEYAWEAKGPTVSPEGLSHPEVLGSECTRSPLLFTVVSHLQHALFSAPWDVRMAACKALATIAFRSGEPYRIQTYRILKEAVSSGGGADPLGLEAEAKPLLSLLDELYSGQMVLEGCLKRWGGNLAEWPEDAQESLRRRDEALQEKVKWRCTVTADGYSALGPISRKLLMGEEVELALPQQAADQPPPEEAEWNHADDGQQEQREAYGPTDNGTDGQWGMADGHWDGNRGQTGTTQDHEEEPSSSSGGWDRASESEEESEPVAQAPIGGLPLPPNFRVGGDSDSRSESSDLDVPESRPLTNVPWAPERTQSGDEIENGDAEALEGEEEAGSDRSDTDPFGIRAKEKEGASSSDQQEEAGSSVSDVDEGDYPGQGETGGGGDTVVVQGETMESSFGFEEGLAYPGEDSGYQESGAPAPAAEPEPYTPAGTHMASVMFDFVAEMEGELTVLNGDQIEVLAEKEGWYLARKGSNEGLVPCSYVEAQFDVSTL
eukprot:evm.model.scf_145EXC.9 EVM.evm.TU.scf_145EXC.9   scf_145EXC:110313-123285(-)